MIAGEPRADRPRRPSRRARRSPTHRADRLRQLGGVARPGRCRAPPSRASTSRTSCATTPAATATSSSSCATTRATSDVVVQTSDTTWQAYNTYGGNSLYTCTVACPPGEPAALQGRLQGLLQPPAQHRAGQPGVGAVPRRRVPDDPLPRGQRLRRQLRQRRRRAPPRPRCCRTTSCSSPAATTSTGPRRSAPAMEAARDAGVNLAFFSGNEGFWKTRWEPSAAGASHGRPHARLLQGHALHRAAGPGRVDGHVARPALHDRGRRRHAGERAHRPVVPRQLRHVATSRCPYAYRQLRMWRNTAAATLGSGQSLDLAPDTLGYEWDVDADNGFRPAGLVPAVLDDRQRRRGVHRLRQHDASSTAPRRTT